MRFSDFRPLLNGASCIGYDNDYRIGGGAEEEDRGHLLKGSYPLVGAAPTNSLLWMAENTFGAHCSFCTMYNTQNDGVSTTDFHISISMTMNL